MAFAAAAAALSSQTKTLASFSNEIKIKALLTFRPNNYLKHCNVQNWLVGRYIVYVFSNGLDNII